MVALIDTPRENEYLGEAGNIGIAKAHSLDTIVLVFALLVGGAVAAASIYLDNSHLPAIVGTGTAIGAVVLLGLASYSVRAFLVAILILRPGLDDIAQDDLGLFQPVSAIGIILLGVSTLWLAHRIKTGAMYQISSVSKALIFYAATITLSAPASLTPVLSMTGALKLWSVVALFMVLEQLYRDDRSSVWVILGASALGLFIPVVTALVQVLATGTVDPITGLVRIDGPFVHPNPFATYLVIAALIATAIFLGSTGQRRIAAAVVLAGCAPVIVLTYARAGWGALFLGLFLIARKLDRRVFTGLGIACVLVIATNPSILLRLSDLTGPEDPTITYENPNSLEWRVGYWVEVTPLVKTNPITGMGLDTVEQVTDVQLPPHNSFVQAFVEAGVLGLAGIIAAVVSLWRLILWGLRRKAGRADTALAVGIAAASLSVFVQLFTENLITGVVPLWYLMVLLAWVSAERERSTTPTPRQHPTQATRIGV